MGILRMRKQEIFLFLMVVSRKRIEVLSTDGSLSSTEYDALHDLYEATNGAHWSWNITADSIPWNFTVYDVAAPCSNSWQGISCNCLNGSCQVQQLYLPNHTLSGTLPTTIGNFPAMTYLNLGINNITGTIPEEISYLNYLEVLELQNNQFIGSLPSGIGNLSALTTLFLQLNFLDGTLPASIFNCTSLILIELANNAFEGSLSSSIKNWAHLTYLNFFVNDFTGSIPREIENLQNLTRFVVGVNHFHGTIPKEIYSLSLLRTVDLSSNNLTGSLSPEIGNLTSLVQWLSPHNYLFGTLPDEWFNSRIPMRTIGLEDNLFSGSINLFPNWKTTLRSLAMNNNLFTGTISPSFNSMKGLVFISLSDNYFHGTTTGFENHPYLGALYFQNNLFSGALPSSLEWINLEIYLGSKNYFTGTFDSDFSNSTSLFYLDVGFNYLTGTLPRYFNLPSRFRYLEYLNFSSNSFSGNLENTFENISALVSFCVSNNELTGPIPIQYNENFHLYNFLLDNNYITGTVPSSLGLFRNLKRLFLQNNQITGTVGEYIQWKLLQVADISNNLLTGLLPLFIFELTNIEVFDASNNCFHGNIPKEICNATSLTVLSFDGLSTAKACRSPIFPGSSLLTAFTLKNSFVNGIPECLFSMPNLETLHLSGNDLSGSLPNNVQISDAMLDLTLSHNRLSGTIPTSFQERTWTNLDLSYNTLTGLLSNQFHSYSSNQSLSLQVNRLSGNIPKTLIHAPQIDMLDGNMFACNYDANELPQHDSNVNNYPCGSDLVNAVIYMWIGIVMFGLSLLLLFLWLHRSGERPFIGGMREIPRSLTDLMDYASTVKIWRRTFINQFHQSSSLSSSQTSVRPISDAYHRIYKLSLFLRNVRFLFVLLTIFVLCILMPVYATLSSYYQVVTVSYAWVLSPLLLSGSTAGVITIVFYFIMIVLLSVSFRIIMVPYQSNRERNESLSSQRSGSGPEALKREHVKRISYLPFIAVGFGNCVIMIIADVLYVLIILRYNTFIITVAELFLAVFKTLLNNTILWEAIPFAHRLIDPEGLTARNNSQGGGEVSTWNNRYRFKARDVLFLSLMIFLNNLVFPALSILLISSDCFYNAIIAAPDVSLTYSYDVCIRYGFFAIVHCEVTDLYIITSSYSPPFIYSFQCASRIVITYASVFILMFILQGFALPTYKLFIKFLYDRRMRREGDLPVKPDVNEVVTIHSSQVQKLERLLKAWYDRLLLAALPRNLHDLVEEPASEIRSSLLLFDKNQLVVKLNAYLVVFMSFGVLFPPLALVSCVAAISLTVYEEIVIGRLFYESDRTGHSWYKKQIDQNCSGVSSGFKHFFWTLVPASCVMYSYLIFDTWGDSEGWEAALPPTIIMLLLPSIFLLLYSNCRSMSFLSDKEEVDRRKLSSTAGLTLSSLNPMHDVENNNTSASNSAAVVVSEISDSNSFPPTEILNSENNHDDEK